MLFKKSLQLVCHPTVHLNTAGEKINGLPLWTESLTKRQKWRVVSLSPTTDWLYVRKVANSYGRWEHSAGISQE